MGTDSTGGAFMFTIETRSTVPIFEQIVDQIGKFIALGIFKSDDQVRPVRPLAKQLGINPNTVSKAYQESEFRQLTYSVPGKGSFINEDCEGISILKQQVRDDFMEVYRKLIELGESQENIIDLIKEASHDTIN